ncbi:MAG: mechanosensitive ion channel family protein [Saprospiraceae bacterium]|nr:mechanosensitive ion channel family protein [Saprospiraceae bacterium]
MFDWLKKAWNNLTETQIKVVVTLTILLGMWLLLRLVIRSIMALKSDISTRYAWRKAATYIIYSIGILSIAVVWSNQFESLATFLGLLSAGLAIAFKDPIVNIAGWYFIVARQPFKVGDRIQVGQHSGDVIDINLFQFTIVEIGNWVRSDQSTGRIIHLANAQIFTAAIANYNAGLDYIWNEISVLITFESDWRKTKTILQEILDENAPQISEQVQKELKASTGRYLIYYTKLTPIVYTSVEDSGVNLTLRYLCEPKQRRNSEEQIWEAILDNFAVQDNIDLAYPTRRTITSPMFPNVAGGAGEDE